MDSMQAAPMSDDLSALAWVQEELRKSLDSAHKALHRFIKESSSTEMGDMDVRDPAPLRQARQQIHQSVGALELAGMPAGATLLRASEALVQKFINRPATLNESGIEAIERGSFALLDYIGRRLAGKSVPAMALFPQYEALVNLVGGSLPRPTDLWSQDWPGLSLEAPLEPPTDVTPRAADEATVNDFESGLLALLKRNQSSDAVALAELCASLARGSAMRHAHRESATWMLASGFLEALAGEHVPLSVHAKRVLSSMLRQLRVLVKGKETPSDRLAQELLFFCAQAAGEQVSPDSVLSRVRRTFGLERHLPVSLSESSLGRYDPTWVAQAIKRVAGAKDGWSAVAAGELLRLGGLPELFALVSESLKKLYPDGEVLADALTHAVAQTVQSSQAPEASLAMEVATSLLYQEASLEDGEFDHPDQRDRVHRLASRIDSVRQGHPAQALESWMEDLYRRVSDRQTIGSVVQELRSNLSEAEKDIDHFFRAPSNPGVLVNVPKQLQSMKGVLAVLGLDMAGQATVRMREDVELLLQVDADVVQAANEGVFDRLATNLGALGFLIDMLGVQPNLVKSLFKFDAETGILSPVMGRERTNVTPAEQPNPIEVVAHQAEREDVQTAAEAVVESVSREDASLSEVSDELQKLADTALVQEQSALAETVASVQEALASAQESQDQEELAQVREQVVQVMSDLAQTMSEPEVIELSLDDALMAPEDGYAVLMPTPVEPAQPTGLEEDDEMLGVFLEEAQEVIANALEATHQLSTHPEDVTLLTSVRRGFHTLKGSSRMVGLNDYGEAGWACEQLFNAWLASQAPASPDLLGFAAEALNYLSGWTKAIEARDAHHWQSTPLIRAAESMRLEGRRVPIGGGSAFTASDEQSLAAEEPAEAAEDDLSTLAVPLIDLGGEPEQVKVIGSLQISIPLFNIYLNEADEQSRRLSTVLSEWALELHRPVSDEAVALAHSLAGNSATVGYAELSQLARLLEHCLMKAQILGAGEPQHAALFNEAADDIRRLLHQFAAGFLKSPQDDLLQRLADYENEASARIEAQSLVVEPPADSEPIPLADPARSHLRLVKSNESEVLNRPVVAPVAQDDRDDLDVEDVVDPDLFPIFEEEAQELLPQLASQLRHWLSSPEDQEAPAACMRTLHTFKGGARLAGAMRLGELAHRLESSIEHLTAQTQPTNEEIEPLELRVDALVEEFEALCQRDALVYQQELSRPLPLVEPAQAPVLIHDADEMPSLPELENTPPAPQSGGSSASIDWSALAHGGHRLSEAPLREGGQTAAQGVVRVKPQLLDRLVNHAGEVSIARTRIASEVGQIRGSLTDLTDNLGRLRQQLRDIELQADTQLNTRLEAARAASQTFDPLEFDRYTRFQELTRMMAESVNDVATVQRSLNRTLETAEDQLAAQARLTRDLQEDLLRTRMVEFEGLSDRLYRVVRQTAKETGKQVKLDIVGGATEVDRGVLERMTGSFEHLLRNCITHGIELPEVRLAAGKPAAGVVMVSLRQEANEVALEFKDDGAGLNLDRIRAKAIAMGLLSADASVDPHELSQLIFTPGFSTAENVTELAGRGVGMDVVRSEVNAMGGRIETDSVAGQGTSFKLVLPLTTAVTKVVMMRCGNANVAVPTHLIEMVRRAKPSEVAQSYESGTYQFADLTLPFYWLGALLQSSPRGSMEGRSLPVVVVRSAQQRIAIHVDEVLGNQEVVVKNLGPQLSRMPGLAGMTLLASGAVSLIYNPVALATVYGNKALAYTQQSALTPDHQQEDASSAVAPEVLPPMILVVDDSLTVRRVTQRLLTREGYRVVLAKDGMEALERLAEEIPVIVLSDIEMPRMDGFDLLRNIRGNPRWETLPVVMISSRIAQKHRDYATQLGANHYLGKPYAEEELLALVARYAVQSGAIGVKDVSQV